MEIAQLKTQTNADGPASQADGLLPALVGLSLLMNLLLGAVLVMHVHRGA